MVITSANKDGNNICHSMIHHSHKWQQQQLHHQLSNIPTMAITSVNKDMAITSANKIHNSGNNICHKRRAVTSAIWKRTIGQHQPIYRHNTHLVVVTSTTKPIQCPKIAGHTNTLTPSVLDVIKNNIFFRPEEAMLETGKSLS